MKRGNKHSQVWVETVVYTLIALTIIGLFLTFAKPKIEEIQDKAVIDQSIEMLEDINSIIFSIVQGGAGNQRVVEVGIKKGTLQVDGVNDQIIFEMEGKYTYSEPGPSGQPGPYINVGNIAVTTQKKGRTSIVTLISNYTNKYNITYEGEDKSKPITKSPVPYKLLISNKGEVLGSNTIDVSII